MTAGPQTEQRQPLSPLYQPTAEHTRDHSSSSSQHNLLPIHHEREGSSNSFSSYSDSIGRAITPLSQLNQDLPIAPEPATLRYPRPLSVHSRQASNESVGLSAPPRRMRMPRATFEDISVIPQSAESKWEPASHRNNGSFGNSISYQHSANSSVDYIVREPERNSVYSRDLYAPRGEVVNGNYNPPLLSAVTPSFPPRTRHSRSTSNLWGASNVVAGRQRSVLAGAVVTRAPDVHRRSYSARAYYP